MKTILYFLIFIWIGSLNILAQVPSQSDIEAMMKEAENKINDALDGLSPEERKMVEEAMAKGKSDVDNINYSIPSSDEKTDIPKKQSALLTKIPKLSTNSEYANYLDKLIAQTQVSIPKNIRDEVDKLVAKHSTNPVHLNNLPPSLLLEKNPKAAMYAALRVAKSNSETLLSQSNLAVILHQTGYPQYALPILEFHLTKNQLPTLYNNAGQCYLSLGDTKKAEAYFALCLKTDPQNYEAHCGTALILVNEDKIPQAIPHIEKAMRNGHSPVLEKLVTDKKIALSFTNFKPKTPEYFNPNKYRAPISVQSLDDIRTALEQRKEITELMYKWGEKQGNIDEKHADKIAKESVSQMSQRFPGLIGNQPFARKAKFMLSESYKESVRLIQQSVNEGNIAVAKNLHEELLANIDKRYKEDNFESSYEECLMLKEETEKYLKKSAEYYDAIVKKTVFKYYDVVNQQLYWNKYLLNNDSYEHMFYGVASELFVHLDEYKKFQLLDRPEWVLNNCEKILQNPPEKTVLIKELPDLDCPFKVKITLGFSNLKMDCKGWEVEGGELLVLSVQKDYKTGELTMAFGLGANLPIPTFVDIGAKGQMFFKFDKHGAPIDTGMVFEAGAEGNIGPVVIEEKATATIGMVSGIHIKGVAAGEELDVFTLEP